MVSESKIRILIVEDEAIVAFDLEQGLKSAGYTVCGVAPSGEEAISLVEKESPDLILMDIRLRSRMTGIEAAKIIRSRFEIPIIYLTAHSDETTLEQAKQTHPYGYLVKPFGQRELRSAIETGLYRAKAEKSLSDSSRWNRLIIDSAHNAFVAMGSDGTISDWNPAAESIFGWKREEVLGKVLAETIIPVNLRAAHYRGLERYLKTGVGPVLNKVLELRALHRDGHEFPVELTIATSDIQGKSHFLSFIRDISERKRLEIEQKRREELERSNEDLERFAHLTSHDLQEPLRTLTMYTELLASRLGSDLGEEEKQFMDYIIGGAERMRELIDDLLSYSRVGTKETTVERIEIKSVIASVLESLGASVASSGATITHDPLPAIMGHFGQIGQLFQNLIANAIKFRREESPPRIHISAEREGEYWLIKVEDNGIGFDECFADQIFGVFKRLHGRDKYPGTGMGLATCKKIVNLHGGRIWANSVPNQGSTFSFTLPAAGVSHERSLDGMRILVVDDSAEARSLMLRLLNGTGAHIDLAKDGVEALEKARMETYDVILMDIEMPGLTGTEATNLIRRDQLQVPVIGFTGYEIDQARRSISRGTFDDFWSKSLSQDSLIRHLQRWRKDYRDAV